MELAGVAVPDVALLLPLLGRLLLELPALSEASRLSKREMAVRLTEVSPSTSVISASSSSTSEGGSS